MMEKTHREIIIDALNFAERNCQMYFKSSLINVVSTGVMYNVENTCLQFYPDYRGLEIIGKCNYLKLAMAIRAFLGAHKIEKKSEIWDRCVFEMNDWDNWRYPSQPKPQWWQMAMRIYENHFIKTPNYPLVKNTDWDLDSTQKGSFPNV